MNKIRCAPGNKTKNFYVKILEKIFKILQKNYNEISSNVRFQTFGLQGKLSFR